MQKVEIEISGVANTMTFDKTKLTVPTGADVHLTLKNPATMATLPHNWALVAPGTQAKVAAEGLAKAPDAGYIIEGPNVLAHTPLARPGGTSEVTFTAPAPGDYPYICTVPGTLPHDEGRDDGDAMNERSVMVPTLMLMACPVAAIGACNRGTGDCPPRENVVPAQPTRAPRTDEPSRCAWCDEQGVPLVGVSSPIVAASLQTFRNDMSTASVKKHLAALRHWLDWLTQKGVLPVNPAASVRGPHHVVHEGKTARAQRGQAPTRFHRRRRRPQPAGIARCSPSCCSASFESAPS